MKSLLLVLTLPLLTHSLTALASRAPRASHHAVREIALTFDDCPRKTGVHYEWDGTRSPPDR